MLLITAMTQSRCRRGCVCGCQLSDDYLYACHDTFDGTFGVPGLTREQGLTHNSVWFLAGATSMARTREPKAAGERGRAAQSGI